MNCDEISMSIPLYFYGELTPEEEERLEDHLDGCQSCRGELESQRAVAAALDRREIDATATLLNQCRQDLMAAVASVGAPLAPVSPPAPPGPSFGERISALLGRAAATVSVPLVPASPPRPSVGERFAGFLGTLWSWKQPIGAVALLLAGYFTAQIVHTRPNSASVALAGEPMIARVRSVQQPDANGRVQISLDEVRQRVVSGRLDDRRIQQLLLAGARDDSDAGVRVESVGILKDHAGSAEVRAALLNSAAHDPNPGVRLKALEGLKSFAGDAQVRKTLTQLLLTDDNPGVRIQAIDMLTASRDDSVVGLLQNVVGKEDNSYVRWRCEKALKDMNASVGTF